MDLDSIILGKLSKNMQKQRIEFVDHKNADYFYLNPKDKHLYMKDRLMFLRDAFLEVLELQEFNPIEYRSTKSFYTYGFISTLTGDKIDDECYIFNTIDHSNIPVKLNLVNCPGYSLFNGQVLALRGKNVNGDEIIVEKIYCFPALAYSKFSKEPLSFNIHKGPFTLKDIDIILNKEQCIKILMGPFCDENNFEFSIEELTNVIEKKIEKTPDAYIIMVPSADDYISVYPQPAFMISSPRIYFVNNPCFLNINNHFILISNFDPILDLSYQEYYKDSKDPKDLLSTSDRSYRLATHLVFQKCLVPVMNSSSAVAYGDWLNVMVPPHVIIVSSKLKSFERKVAFTSVINTGDHRGQCCEIHFSVQSNSYTTIFSTIN